MSLRNVLRKPIDNTKWAVPISLKGKTAIVTGCGKNSLGFATARTLAAWGAKVVITTRKEVAAVVDDLRVELDSYGGVGEVHGHELDLSVSESVNEFTEWYSSQASDGLDILVNNAGIHLDLLSKWKQPNLTNDGYEIHWRTNFLGTLHLILNLLPLMRQRSSVSGDVRIVNVSSQLHTRADNTSLTDPDTVYESWKFYGRSKLALMHISNELNRRYGDEYGLRSYTLHPGGKSGVATDVSAKGLSEAPLLRALTRFTGPVGRLFMSSPEEGAQTQIHCATSATPPIEGYYVNSVAVDPSDALLDAGVSKRLWQESEQLIRGWCNGLTNNV